MSEFEQAVILITIDSREAADRLAEILLGKKLAACVNILPDVSSHFWWKGAPDTEKELLLVIKTRASLVDDIVVAVKDNHPYDVPEVIALPIIGGNPDYLAWLDAETRPQ